MLTAGAAIVAQVAIIPIIPISVIDSTETEKMLETASIVFRTTLPTAIYTNNDTVPLLGFIIIIRQA